MARFKVYGSVEVQVEAWFDADEEIDNRQIEDLGGDAIWKRFHEWVIAWPEAIGNPLLSERNAEVMKSIGDVEARVFSCYDERDEQIF